VNAPEAIAMNKNSVSRHISLQKTIYEQPQKQCELHMQNYME